MDSLFANYNNTLKDVDYATFFHTPMWLETVKHYWGQPYLFEYTVINGKEIFYPISLYICNSEEMAFSTFKGYGGLVCREQLQYNEVNIALKYLLSKYNKIKIRDNPLNPIISESISTNIDSTYIIDKFNYSYNTLRTNHKRNIKLAIDSGIEINETKSILDWKEFYNKCYMSTVRAWNNPSIIYDFSIFDYLKQYKDNVSLIIAKYKSKIICGSVLLKFNQHVHYWISGTNVEFKKLCPNHLLIHRVVEELKYDQYRYLDLGVSGNNKNILYFKSGFRGKIFDSNQFYSSNDFSLIKKKLSNINIRECQDG